MVNTGDEGIKNKFFYDLKSLFPLKPEVDEPLIQSFKNVELESNENDSQNINELSSGGDDSIGKCNMKYPIRPDVEDCPFYIRTGTCKFGRTCKFNHPTIGSPIPCKFYQTGLCKYGESCRFSHSISEVDKFPMQYTFLGYPKRLGKINCSFYMRTGMCKYGTSCRFNHPDPIFVLEPELFGSAVIGEPMNIYNEDSQSTQSYSLPQMTPSLQYVYQTCVLRGYQASDYKQEVEMVEYYPEDPHKRKPCVLNEIGLPMRHGKKVCWNYENLGLCKSGRACAYDHPKKNSSTYGSTSESVFGGEDHK